MAARELGLGCMRLSTDAGRDDERNLAVLRAALDAGITLLDTADAYSLDDTDVGHNERLIARARKKGSDPFSSQAPETSTLEEIGADPSTAQRLGSDPFSLRVVTKGGLTRPGGAWVPNGRAKHLAAAARASRDRLGVDAIDLYLLHAIDPKTPLATSVRALAKLRDDGVARAIGLSNVTLLQLEEAEAITRIDAVEVELHPWKLDALRGGLIAACEARGIELLAYRPLGGPAGVKRIGKDEVVRAIAARMNANGSTIGPSEIVLAWLRSLSPVIIPIPGATRVETASSAAREVVLDDEALAALRARFVAIGDEQRSTSSSLDRGEVVLVIGMPGAGKSTLAEDLVGRGYHRLNRDERGGSLLELAHALDRDLTAGATRVVLDNTYPSRASRAPLVELAHRHGLAIRCVVLATPIERAQANAVARMLAIHGKLLEPSELRGTDIGPGAQFRWRRAWEPPRSDEGFDAIEEVAFVPRAASTTETRPALIVELDDIVWRGRPRTVAKVELREGARDAIHAWRDAGSAIVATTWQPDTEPAAVDALIARLYELIGFAFPVGRCAHPAGPPVCWCRKPLPGLALWLAHAHELDLARSITVGAGPADKGFALRAGVAYHDVAAGWPTPDDRGRKLDA